MVPISCQIGYWIADVREPIIVRVVEEGCMIACDACGTQHKTKTAYCSWCGQSLGIQAETPTGPGAAFAVRLRARTPSLVTSILRPDEQVLASYRARMFVLTGTRADHEARDGKVYTLIMTTQRILFSRGNKEMGEVTYGKVVSVLPKKTFFGGLHVIVRVPKLQLDIKATMPDEAVFVSWLVDSGKMGTLRATTPTAHPSTPRLPTTPAIMPYQAPKLAHALNLDTIDPLDFEELVRVLFERLGYQASMTKRSHDGGIDIEAIDPTPIRGGRLLIQCKRYSNVVGSPYVRDLYGVVQHERASKGILVTTSHFSPDAIAFASDKPIELIARDQLEELLDQHGLLRNISATYSQVDLMPASSVGAPNSPPLSAASTSFPSSRPQRTIKRLVWMTLGYGLGALFVLEIVFGVWAAFLLGLLLLLTTYLASNRGKLRQRIPVFNSRYRPIRVLGYAGLRACV